MAKSKKSKISQRGKNLKKPNRVVIADQTISASSSTNQQVNSKLMQLPQEIRDEIYATVFRSTRLTIAERYLGYSKGWRVLSSSRGTMLSVLLTCRRVRDEIGVSWLHQVLFCFEDNMALLGKLTAIPIAVRSQIRHLRVSGQTMMVWDAEGGDSYYTTAQVLKLLPGLRLDTLTVLDDSLDGSGDSSYEALDKLVRYGNGWKELHWLSRSSELLGYKVDDDMSARDLRQPQPFDWQTALEQRDGQASHPSVVIYRATTVTTPGDVLQPSTRSLFTQAFGANQDARTFGRFEYATLMAPGETEKELMVVVKRGAGVSYAEKKGSPYLSIGDIRKDRRGETWKKIKAKNDAYNRMEDSDITPFTDDGIADAYSHVDEYTWPSLRSWDENMAYHGYGKESAYEHQEFGFITLAATRSNYATQPHAVDPVQVFKRA